MEASSLLPELFNSGELEGFVRDSGGDFTIPLFFNTFRIMLKSLLHIAVFHQQSTMEPSLMNRNEVLLESSRRDMPSDDVLLA